MRRTILALVIIVGLLIPTSFWCGSQWRLWTQKAIASDEARWIARYWQEDKSMNTICMEIRREQGGHILRDEWDLGEAPDAALGPVVGGNRVCVRRDRSIYWRTAQ